MSTAEVRYRNHIWLDERITRLERLTGVLTPLSPQADREPVPRNKLMEIYALAADFTIPPLDRLEQIRVICLSTEIPKEAMP